ncbi:MAG: squalene synthase HpnC [Mycobacteriales bacterium]
MAADPVEASVGGRLAVLAQAGAENFPVASRLLPVRLRRDLLAVYGYARLVDDVGDEAPGDRAALLDRIAADLARLYSGQGAKLPTVAALGRVAARVPAAPFLDLLTANRIDQSKQRYQTFEELIGYCRYSANPVGRIVLHLTGFASPVQLERSDRVCTALQVIEHLQDVAEDFSRGRIYLPLADLERFGVSQTDLAGGQTPAQVRRLVGFEAARAASLLDAGAPLVGSLRGPARIAVAGYVGGGRAALAALAAADYAVLAGPPTAGRRLRARQALQTFLAGR